MAVKFASDEYLRLKAEVSRLASMANKRIVRIENNGLQDSPAYAKWVKEGGQKFSVRGKDYNQLQHELARVRTFVNSKTSTIRGLNRTLKEMAENTGIKYGSIKELQSKSKNFFALAQKIETYLRQTEQSASAIGYRPIWEAINSYVEQEKIDLGDANLDIGKLTQQIGQMTTYEKVEKGLEGYKSDNGEWEYF